ncbi:MAG TPA: hypothetical protein ACFYD3_05530 [Candidatus Hypogeohydataceae bacterium YC41]
MRRGLASASLSNKVFFSFFLIFMGISMGVAFLNFIERTKFSPEKVESYYLGNLREGEPEDAPLPKEGMLFPKTRRELLEVTHVHTFSIPLIFFVLSRILSMTTIREGVKMATYVASFVGIGCILIGPWLVRYVYPGFSLLLLFSYIVLASTLIVYIACPMYEMWGIREEGWKGMVNEE